MGPGRTSGVNQLEVFLCEPGIVHHSWHLEWVAELDGNVSLAMDVVGPCFGIVTSLEKMEQDLDRARVPSITEGVSGSEVPCARLE